MIHEDNSPVPWWQAFVDAIDKLPFPQRMVRLAELAIMLRQGGDESAAKVLALRAWRQACEADGGRNGAIALRVLSAVTRGYQLHMYADATRIAAWQAALAGVIRPGMLALKIGAGTGILSMLAARAGAEVVSCEKDPILAAIALQMVGHNGLAGRVRILGKSSDDLRVPEDLPRPADLLILDLFANNLFAFNPFKVMTAARRLLQPGAVAVPMRVSLEAALADLQRWRRTVAGLDLSPLIDMATLQVNLDPDEPDLSIRSAAEPMVCARLPDDLPAEMGVSERAMISKGGPVNGIVLWLRLELARGVVIEARPGNATPGSYARPRFYAFSETIDTLPGQSCSIRLRWKDNSVSVSRIKS